MWHLFFGVQGLDKLKIGVQTGYATVREIKEKSIVALFFSLLDEVFWGVYDLGFFLFFFAVAHFLSASSIVMSFFVACFEICVIVAVPLNYGIYSSLIYTQILFLISILNEYFQFSKDLKLRLYSKSGNPLYLSSSISLLHIHLPHCRVTASALGGRSRPWRISDRER